MEVFTNLRWRGARVLVVAVTAFLAVGGALSAQQLTGNIFGFVQDEQGGRLPGVTVTGEGATPISPQSTDARGEYRFLNLAPGVYVLKYELPGFTTVTKPDVQVGVNINTNTSATMRLSGVEATMTVRGEAALLESRKVSTGANISQVELRSIPTARDPWVILQTVPGVMTDRVNIGGSESGQQSLYVSKGTASDQGVWNLDGITITDMAALGSTGTYYDFDSFEEINATTGGSDITAATPGVQLNLVTKRGTNDVHGSARVLLTEEEWQSKTNTSEYRAQAAAQNFTSGNRISEVQDYGVEIGGPIIRDRLWLWGAYGRNQIDLLLISPTAAAGTVPVPASDRTTLEDKNGKLNLQLFESTSLSASYTAGDKIKFGRNVGPTREPNAAWNQSGIDGNPSALYKGEISHVFSSKLFMTVSHAYFDGGFQLEPVGGTSRNDVFNDESGVWRNGYLDYRTVRPSHFTGANGSFFFNTGSMGHELKFGGSYRHAPVTSFSTWPGNGNWGTLDYGGPGIDAAVLTRDGIAASDQTYWNAYLGDTMTIGNLTVNAGVRYDLQFGNNIGASAPANPTIPEILPALSGEDGPQEFEWEDISPRIGLTYALGPQRKLLLKGSYARFADQMGSGFIAFNNPAALAGVYMYWNDANNNRIVERSELDFDSGIIDFYGFDPDDPASSVSTLLIDPDLKAGTTDEIVLGADYELLPEFVVGLSYTHRLYKDDSWTHNSGISASDFIACTPTSGRSACANRSLGSGGTLTNGVITGTTTDGIAYSMPVFALRPGVSVGPSLEENRPDYETTFDGVDLTFQKRLSNRWMVRGNLSWNDWTFDTGNNGCFDPTHNLQTSLDDICGSGTMVQAVGTGSGAKGNVFINSTWQANIGGLYELPLGFNIAANVFAREGYPLINWFTFNPGDGLGTRNVILGDLDDRRHEDVINVDLRLEKVVNVNPLQISIGLDVFNVFNAGTVLQRQGRVNIGTYNQITETQSPRIVRAGARVSF